MNVHRNPPHRIVVLAALAVVATLAIAGCAQKVTNPDASYALDPSYVTNPAHGGIEGLYTDRARMVVYADVPAVMDSFEDVAPKGQFGPEDVKVGSWTFRFAPPGTIHGVIADGTAANAFQVLRRERNGGFALLQSYLLTPVTRMTDTGWELYRFDDARPSGSNPPAYVGRGVVSGVVTKSSPLTNLSALPQSSPVPNLVYTGATGEPPVPPPDTNLVMSWRPVTGAAGYWIQVYEYPAQSMTALIAVSPPAPFATQYVRDHFVAYMPASVTQYQIGQPLPDGAQVLIQRPLIAGRPYFVRISAVDDQGEMIAFTYGTQWQLPGINGFYVGRYGAVMVLPVRSRVPSYANTGFGAVAGR